MQINIEGLIPLAGGVCLWMLSRNSWPMGKKPAEQQQWRKQWGGVLVWLAPVLMGFGLLRLFGLMH